ncbi:penicillin-binding protein [Mangrovactinospora gilvigrisea]|uniref:Penicillin-binding protein n=1 Tax=Mangrovactinospora gilvigrisea TaxID=1428644 RepID=A0A1J7BEX5_9ACTN|nr:penicillin-binding transpeptidase domain-containing protein [Mangrovactinospora gilvigrisea]OIV37255.1 penicillin-binding protein [Mangrovactinospora gilvigrisea]
MNKPLRRVSIFCLVLVMALMVRANWVQAVKGHAYASNVHNQRVAYERYSHPRGNIIVGGKPITGSVEAHGKDSIPEYKYKRTYTDGPMYAPITGYSSQVFGSSRLETLEDPILSGTDDRLFFRNTLDELEGKERQGGSVVTTIDPAVQKAGWDALQGKKGAAVAIDPSTGKILGLVSFPSYDPSSIAGSGNESAKNWKSLNTTEKSLMQDRAMRELYFPGSTFKIVTAAAALENGLYTSADQKTDTPKNWTLPGTTTPLPNESEFEPCQNATLAVGLAVSCNTVFGKMGYDIDHKYGKGTILKEAEKFGFNQSNLDTPIAPSTSNFDKNMNDSQTALSSIGQFDTKATPLQMAMVAAAVANNGTLMKPYLVDKLQAANLSTVQQTQPQVYSHPLNAKNASVLQQMMEGVVNNPLGTGAAAKISGAEVGGKTGTAQNGLNNSGTPYAWFISYAKVNGNAKVAVAAVVTSSSTVRGDVAGGKLAAPVAKAMMEAAINK